MACPVCKSEEVLKDTTGREYNPLRFHLNTGQRESAKYVTQVCANCHVVYAKKVG